jgi:Cytochrome P450
VPGPRSLPIIGNAFELPEYPEKQYMKWASEYGELFQVQLGWNNWVFVCSEQAAKAITPFHCPTGPPMTVLVPRQPLEISLLGLLLTIGNSRQTIRQNIFSSLLPRSPGHRLWRPSHPLHVLLRKMASYPKYNPPTLHPSNVRHIPSFPALRIKTINLRSFNE